MNELISPKIAARTVQPRPERIFPTRPKPVRKKARFHLRDLEHWLRTRVRDRGEARLGAAGRIRARHDGENAAASSSRNSKVIHAGVYYPPGLDGTRLRVEGKAMLYDFSREYGAPHKRWGTLLVVANVPEIEKLAAVIARLI